ncbi:hypothetical protein [Sphingomonas koreensis]|uniref:hypothetical protein n=1 Tax=Sphingomonas koreensis TaxID=93064 RepID=UPI000F7DCC66|nr:hypothetical protein [Sphingomonas koreensis]
MFEQDVGIGHATPIGTGSDIREIRQKRCGTIDFGKDRFDKRRRSGNTSGIAVHSEFALRRIDFGISLDRSDRLCERAFDQIPPGFGRKVSLPREENVLRHRPSLIVRLPITA